MRVIAATACFVLSLMAARGPVDAQERKGITESAVAAIRAWVNAVQSHEPGRSDSPVVTLAALSYEEREQLNAGMALFLETLLTKKVSDDAGSDDAQRIMALGRDAGDANSFLKRAAVLHADVAAYGDHPNSKRRPPSDREVRINSGMGFTAVRPGEAVSPLLRSDRLTLGQDGQTIGETLASWNWPFARFLLDRVGGGVAGSVLRGAARPENAKDPFVGAWYHATTAYMFANSLYGEATPHLHDAARLLPDDARIVFDRGCYAELLGLPMHQEMLSAWDIVALRSRASFQDREPQWRMPGSSPALNIPLAETTNADAERLFKRTLAIDPSLVEARVRLARLLSVRGRHNEAGAELTTALAANPVGVVGFYARLFAGRAAQARGQNDEASAHYLAARALFPDAQSALLGSSQLALQGADVPAALEPLQRLGASSEVFTADPWWQYYLCGGRDADDLLEALWASVPRQMPWP